MATTLPSSQKRGAEICSYLCNGNNTGYVNYAETQANKGREIRRQDEALRDRLAKLLIQLRQHYGQMLPSTWLERPASFYSFALDLIGEIRGTTLED